jgi:hypothetical protein
MKILSIAAIASVALAGNVLAADSLRIESEAQFVRDYGGQIEQVGPGVYQIISGDLVGKTVSIGETGLEYDLNTQRALAANIAKSSSAKANSDTLILKLEEQQARYAQLRLQTADSANDKKAIARGAFPCVYRPFNGFPVWYSGFADISATTEFYWDTGNGTLSSYYARATALANGYVFTPSNVPLSLSIFAQASTNNAYTGESVSRYAAGYSSVSTGTPYIYSGPSFSHNMNAYAAVSGAGNCFGYASVSDSIRPYY